MDNSTIGLATLPSAYAIADTGRPLLIGRRNSGDWLTPDFFPVDGRLDEIAIWGRALTDEECSSLYNNGNGRPLNSAPIANAGTDQTVEQATADGTKVDWHCLAADVCDAEVDVVCVPPSGSVFPLGVTTVTCTATDDSGNQTVRSFTVTVKDTTAPVIESAWATPNVLWPPNHKMADVAVGAVVGDICDAAPAWKIIGVASNEPINGLGDGDTAPDWLITGEHSLKLRAERSGKGSGRVYTITIQAIDASGNAATGAVLVTVPHDQKK